jgi:hypothetical protein
MMKAFLFLILILNTFSSFVFAGPTKVGNGDDGSDIEGFTEVKSGKIYNSRARAVSLLKKLNILGVPHLGSLLPEVENTKLYMTKRNISAKLLEELGAFHSGNKRKIYARTFARPYAVTRFFPVALELDESQLVALHIHEALHRSLPVDFREDERVISLITLSIVSPLASHDLIKDIVHKNIDYYTGNFKKQFRNYYAQIEVEYASYLGDEDTSVLYTVVDKIMTVKNRIYPFQGSLQPIGLGVDITKIDVGRGWETSTIGLYGSYNLLTANGFDIVLHGLWNRDSGNSENSDASYLARDSFRIGMSFEKRKSNIVIKHTVENVFGKNFDKDYDDGTVNHEFGSRFSVSSQLLVIRDRWQFGVEGKLSMFGVSSHTENSITYENSRSTILSFEPIAKWVGDKYTYTLKSNIALEDGSESGMNLHRLESEGQGQFYISLDVGYKFK